DGARADAVAAAAQHERAPARHARRAAGGRDHAAPPLMPGARRGGRLLVLLLVAAALIAFFASGAHRYLGFERLKAEQAHLEAWYRAHPAGTAAGFFVLYVAVTGLSIPGAAALTLVAGAIFGLVRGTILVSFASALGATIAFLVSRF